MKTKRVTKYVANDGTEFESKIECQKHDLALHIEKALTEEFGESTERGIVISFKTYASFIADRYVIKFP